MKFTGLINVPIAYHDVDNYEFKIYGFLKFFYSTI